MSKEVQNKILEYIEKQIKHLRSISVAWFGGEPLLAFNIIKNMSEKIIKMCEKNEIVYESFIVTNGYNLTRKIGKELSNLKISFAQCQ